uniref:SH3 domain-containing YSC84-like protein 1 n=1 Tax=Bos indicus x Bos taurus TaxID=30522 RepID=A0A4W2IF23_BOBOX
MRTASGPPVRLRSPAPTSGASGRFCARAVWPSAAAGGGAASHLEAVGEGTAGRRREPPERGGRRGRAGFGPPSDRRGRRGRSPGLQGLAEPQGEASAAGPARCPLGALGSLQSAQVSDLVIILNYDRAVEAFAKGGNLTLGGNLTVAVGPLGRNLEGNVSLRSSAAVFTYCKSRGLFAGISLEGSCLIERKETNRKFYCQDIRAYDILFGDITRPAQAEDLYEVLDSFTEKYEIEGQRVNARRAAREQKKASAKLPPKPSSRPEQSSAQVQLSSGSQSSRNEYNLYPELSSYRERVGNSNQPIEVTALYSFEGQQPGDLNFQAGDRITVISKTDSHFDWWEGKLRGRTGIFPANYVTMN